jgi:hypothetical protein
LRRLELSFTIASPGFFIVGAPKCGTTALYSFLSEHEQIYMPWIKEPHYFASELEKSRVRPIDNLDEYLGLFELCGPQYKVAGEASVFYLTSPNAIQNIRRFNSQAKIILMVRNPIDMFASLHSQLYLTLDEDRRDPVIAWGLQDERLAGRAIPRTCRIPEILQYRRTCSLGALTQKVLEVFPREQVKIVLFDDFIAYTREVYKKILAFLGVPFDGRVDFPPVNENKVARLRFVASLYHDRGILRSFWNTFEKHRTLRSVGYNSRLQLIYTLVHWVYMRLNTKTVKRSRLGPELRSELGDAFREDVERLSELMGRNLGHWLVDPRK